MDFSNAQRAAELADRAAKTGDPAMAAAAQAYATLALVEATNEQTEQLRIASSSIEDLDRSLGSTLQNLTEQVEGLRYK
ncbi:hypothetical protein P8A21_03180 [Streptomyces poriferorum]|uniref:Uncharacterized protein n=1 Tax=Streptomyces poriferorum TaxID=2798799 RepID=A0ABY9J2F5_9ACTN|nr:MULTISPECIES: hypothetical protein [unclassified Streptomyces]MDP5309977.1 hypothetical protein [Streptomyces sp. Alt4]WLQ46560.1 hypothetical protein P8A21_03180 [Streptomyces sp. Alt1]WLQ60851.1 hypothetical protein P8A19_37885 [Streptomyces sp. Alt2]